MKSIVKLALAAGLLAAPLAEAQAAALFWSKFRVRTDTEPKCLQLAFGVASRQGLANIRRNQLEVAGHKNGALISITCVGPTAVVMAVSDSEGSAIAMRDEIALALSRTGFID